MQQSQRNQPGNNRSGNRNRTQNPVTPAKAAFDYDRAQHYMEGALLMREGLFDEVLNRQVKHLLQRSQQGDQQAGEILSDCCMAEIFLLVLKNAA